MGRTSLIDLMLGSAVMAAGIGLTFEGYAKGNVLQMIGGSVGPMVVVLFPAQARLKRLRGERLRTFFKDFPFGVFVAAGLLAGEACVIAGYFMATKRLIWCSPLAAILGGVVCGALARGLNGRLAAIDERISDFVGWIMMLVLPAYIVWILIRRGVFTSSPAVVPASSQDSKGFFTNWWDAIPEGAQNAIIVVLIVVVAVMVLLAAYSAIQWVRKHHEDHGAAIALGLRFLAFGVLIGAPVLFCTVVFYRGVEDELMSVMAVEVLVLLAVFGIYAFLNKKAPQFPPEMKVRDPDP